MDVLRQGVVDLNVTIQLAFFKPAHGLTRGSNDPLQRQPGHPDSPAPIRARSRTRPSTWCLLVNGIPVATAELKNPLTNQNIEHAIEQYRQDRDPGMSRSRDGHSSTSPWTPTEWR